VPALLETMASMERAEAALRPSRGTEDRVQRGTSRHWFLEHKDRRRMAGWRRKSAPTRDRYNGDADNATWRGSLIHKGFNLFLGDSRDFLLGVMIKTVRRRRQFPAISANLAPSMAAARGWHAARRCFQTRRFSAGGYREEIRRGPGERRQRRGFFGRERLVCSLPCVLMSRSSCKSRESVAWVTRSFCAPARGATLPDWRYGDPKPGEDLAVTKCLVVFIV